MNMCVEFGGLRECICPSTCELTKMISLGHGNHLATDGGQNGQATTEVDLLKWLEEFGGLP